MKSTMGQPTQVELIQYFLDDSIGRNEDIYDLLSLLSSIDGYYSIALDGCWGSGKTIFVKQAKLIINAINIFAVDNIGIDERGKIEAVIKEHFSDFESLTQISAVYYDAWANDNDIDPIVSMLLSIASTTNNKANRQKERDALDIIAKAADVITGRKVSELVKELRGEKKIDASKDITDKMQASILELLESILVEHAERLVLFIDELDRCRPTYAMKLLEQIEHYFHSDKITFVFSTNIEQLQHTVKCYYGEAFDGARYLNRFFDMVVPIPEVNMEKFLLHVKFKKSLNSVLYIYEKMLVTRVPSLREKSKYIQTMETIFNWKDDAQRNRMCEMIAMRGITYDFAAFVITPIIIALRIENNGDEQLFIQGKLVGVLIDALESYDTYTYFTRNLLGADETFEQDAPNEKVTCVNFDSKVRELYNAFFTEKYDEKSTYHRIGNYSIDNRVKNYLMEISNPMHTLYKSGGRK